MEENIQDKLTQGATAADAEERQTLHKLKREYDLAYNHAFLRRLDYWCKQKGWSNRELANRSKISLSTIYNWKRKGNVPHVIAIAMLCDAFGILFSQLVDCDFTEEEKIVIQNYRDFEKKHNARMQLKNKGVR